MKNKKLALPWGLAPVPLFHSKKTTKNKTFATIMKTKTLTEWQCLYIVLLWLFRLLCSLFSYFRYEQGQISEIGSCTNWIIPFKVIKLPFISDFFPSIFCLLSIFVKPLENFEKWFNIQRILSIKTQTHSQNMRPVTNWFMCILNKIKIKPVVPSRWIGCIRLILLEATFICDRGNKKAQKYNDCDKDNKRSAEFVRVLHNRWNLFYFHSLTLSRLFAHTRLKLTSKGRNAIWLSNKHKRLPVSS